MRATPNSCSWPAQQRFLSGRHTATGGNGCLHTRIHAGGHHGQPATHGVACHTKSLSIHFRLICQQRQPTAGGDGNQKPVVISWAGHRIECFLIRLDRGVVGVVACLGGIHGAPGGAGITWLGILQQTATPID